MVAQWKHINENYKNLEGYKRVAWPPASEERVVREFTPQPHAQYSAPAYNPQAQEQQQPPQSQQYQPTAAAVAATLPPTQQLHHHLNQQQNQPHTPYSNSTSTHNNNHPRESISPYYQRQQGEDLPEPFPPQTPETPIVLVDKQFSRLASQEPMPKNNNSSFDASSPAAASASYQPEWQKPREEVAPTFNQPSQYYQQQYQTPRYQQTAQHQHQQHQYQQQQTQYQPQNRETTPGGGWSNVHRPQPKQEFAYAKPAGDVGHDEPTGPATPIYQKQFESYHKQQRQETYQHHQHHSQQEYHQQHQYQPPKQYSPQPQYQGQAPGQIQYQPQQQHSQPSYQQQPWVQENHLPQPYKPPTQQGAYQALQQRQASPYQQQPAYQVPSNNQYQAPHYQQQHQQYQNQYVSQTNQQQQFNSYSQPQQTNGHDQLDHLQQSHDQRGASPGIITLRKEAPISQAPAPVYTSQPAAVSYQGGNKLRGDLKWPPPEYKEAAAVENAERRKLAAGPVCRPRRVARDYTEFFAKNALSHHYPSYKVPPGTQHMIN